MKSKLLTAQKEVDAQKTHLTKLSKSTQDSNTKLTEISSQKCTAEAETKKVIYELKEVKDKLSKVTLENTKLKTQAENKSGEQ